MFRSAFTHVMTEWYYVAVVFLLLIVAGVGLYAAAPTLSRVDVAAPAQPLSNADAVEIGATDTQPGAGIREMDAYSAQLDRLRQRAHRRQRVDDANAFALQLDALAREGRAAYVDARLSTSATAYVYHLDALRRMGQQVYAASGASMDANAYSRHLDELRRLGQSDQGMNTVPADPNEYAYWLDHLRRLGQ